MSVFLAPAIVIGCVDRKPPSAIVTDSAGVRMVVDASEDRGLTSGLNVVAELRVPDNDITVVPWGVVADRNTRQVFVLDWTGARVAVFGPDGSHAGWFGQRGEGPGEFVAPVAMTQDEHGALLVLDAGRGILSRWSTTGDLLNEERGPPSYWGPGFAAIGRGLNLVQMNETNMLRRQDLVRLVGGSISELYSATHELVLLDLPCGRFQGHRVFSPDIVWGSRGDTTYLRRGTGYRIDVLVHDSIVSSIRRALDPVRVTRTMANGRVEAGPYTGLLKNCGTTPEQIVTAAGYEEAVSPILWLTPGPKGQLWVTRSANGVDPDRTDVLAPDGEYLGTMEGAGLPVSFLSDTLFVSVARNRWQEVTLTLYEIRSEERDDTERVGSQSARPRDRPLAETEFRDCPDCPILVTLPPGRFLMGRVPGEAPASADPNRPDWTEAAEDPQVEVEIGEGIAIGKYEVTFAEWDQCFVAGACSREPADEGWGRGAQPVIHVTRDDAAEFTKWLSQKTGHEYRLPTEAEWEYAARAGVGGTWWWGEEIGVGNTVCNGCGSSGDNTLTSPVGSFLANPFGLHDMLGNVSEWVADCWHDSHHGRPETGIVRVETSPWWIDGKCQRPMRKGGAFSYYTWTTRPAARFYWRPRPTPPQWPAHSKSVGFRVVRVQPPSE